MLLLKKIRIDWSVDCWTKRNLSFVLFCRSCIILIFSSRFPLKVKLEMNCDEMYTYLWLSLGYDFVVNRWNLLLKFVIYYILLYLLLYLLFLFCTRKLDIEKTNDKNLKKLHPRKEKYKYESWIMLRIWMITIILKSPQELLSIYKKRTN